MSESDFVDITRNGELCNSDGEIGQGEFQAIMRREVPLLPHTNGRKGSLLRLQEARHMAMGRTGSECLCIRCALALLLLCFYWETPAWKCAMCVK